MRRLNKTTLYENIMRDVSKTVKKYLNESSNISDYMIVKNYFQKYVNAGYLTISKSNIKYEIAQISFYNSTKHKEEFTQQCSYYCGGYQAVYISIMNQNNNYFANIIYDTDYGWDYKAGEHGQCFTKDYTNIEGLCEEIDHKFWLSDYYYDDFFEWFDKIKALNKIKRTITSMYDWNTWNSLSDANKNQLIKKIYNKFKNIKYKFEDVSDVIIDTISEELTASDF